MVLEANPVGRHPRGIVHGRYNPARFFLGGEALDQHVRLARYQQVVDARENRQCTGLARRLRPSDEATVEVTGIDQGDGVRAWLLPHEARRPEVDNTAGRHGHADVSEARTET